MKKNFGKKKIYILLTRFRDTGSRMLSTFTGSYYTHASIGFEEDAGTFYSFVKKGFIVEDISRYIKKSQNSPFPCRLYELSVPKRIYKSAKSIVLRFADNRKNMKYTLFGVIMCLFGVKYENKCSYFCSQFVAHVLKKSGAVTLKRASCLYFPEDLGKISSLKLNYTGNLQNMLWQFGIPTCYVLGDV